MKLLKVLLPVLIDFGVFWTVVYFNMPNHPMRIGEIGNGNLYSLMAYFSLFWGLLLVDGVLTQYLIIIPLWNRGINKGLSARLIIFSCIALVCILFAGGLSYIIWLPEDGYDPLLRFWWYMLEIQVVYWIINFTILFLLDLKKFGKKTEPAEPEIATS
jgi:hypothetical protein